MWLPGAQARDELIESLCKKEMGVYTAIFSSSGDTAVRRAAPAGMQEGWEMCRTHGRV